MKGVVTLYEFNMSTPSIAPERLKLLIEFLLWLANQIPSSHKVSRRIFYGLQWVDIILLVIDFYIEFVGSIKNFIHCKKVLNFFLPCGLGF